MYTVIHEFLDLQDNSYYYKVGDMYPRNGYKPTLERETELLGKSNKIGVPLIEEIMAKPVEDDTVEAKPVEEKPKRTRARK